MINLINYIVIYIDNPLQTETLHTLPNDGLLETEQYVTCTVEFKESFVSDSNIIAYVRGSRTHPRYLMTYSQVVSPPWPLY